jgi:hypothetical protein
MFSTSAAFLLNRREFDDLISRPHPNAAAETAHQDLIARQDVRAGLGERYRNVNTSHTRAQDNDNERMENFHEGRLVTATNNYNRADEAVIEAREAFADAAGVAAPSQAPRETHLPCNPRVEEDEDSPNTITGEPAPAPAPAPAPESVSSDNPNSSTNNPDGEDEGGEGGNEGGGEGGNEGGGSENYSGNGNSSSANGGLNKVIYSSNWDENLAPEDVEESLNWDENLVPEDVEELIQTLRVNSHMTHISTPGTDETGGFWSSLLDLI